MGYFESGRMLPKGHIIDIGNTVLNETTVNRLATGLLITLHEIADPSKTIKEVPNDAQFMIPLTGEMATVQRGNYPTIIYVEPGTPPAINTFRAAVNVKSMARRLK